MGTESNKEVKNTIVIQRLKNEKYSYTPSGNDSGMDLFHPRNETVPGGAKSYKLHLDVKMSLYNDKNTNIGYMLLARSSTGSKTPLRLSNSVGIIDSGYRGELIACVDNLEDEPFELSEGNRYFQVVPFDGRGIQKVTMGCVDETDRGDGGFGSTGA